MHFNHGNANRADRIANRDTGVSVGAWVYQYYFGAISSLLNSVNNLAFRIGLEGLYGDTEFAPKAFERAVDVSETSSAVNLGFAFAEQIEVGAVDYEGARHRRRFRRITAFRPGGALFPLHFPHKLLAGIEHYRIADFKQGQNALVAFCSGDETIHG